MLPLDHQHASSRLCLCLCLTHGTLFCFRCFPCRGLVCRAPEPRRRVEVPRWLHRPLVGVSALRRPLHRTPLPDPSLVVVGVLEAVVLPRPQRLALALAVSWAVVVGLAPAHLPARTPLHRPAPLLRTVARPATPRMPLAWVWTAF
jgi:hypothetical protein